MSLIKRGMNFTMICKHRTRSSAVHLHLHASAGVEFIGEAARRISQETRDKYPQIPWREMTSMRNLVIHEYDVVDINQVWDTVQNKLPSLIEELSKIVPPE